jgi:hypothetical protein
MDEGTERRAAHNESIFREANEAIERGLWPGEDHAAVRFRCECSRLECNQALELSLSDYERVRESPNRFVLLPGHELPEVELVVERQPGFVVVEKRGAADEVAERENPRA